VASEPGQGGPQFNKDAAYAGPRLLMVASGLEDLASPASPGNLAVEEFRRLGAGSRSGDLAADLEQGMAGLKETFSDLLEPDAHRDGMAVMLTAMLWRDTHAMIAHVGSTRAYMLREGELTQLTRDHTVGQALVDEGAISAGELGSDRKHSYVVRWLAGEPTEPPELFAHKAEAGDRYLLATDGIQEILSFESLRDVLRDTSVDLQDVADEIAAQAFPAEEFHSGVTVVVADVVDRSRASVRAAIKRAGPGFR
jgi:protein phosphatase